MSTNNKAQAEPVKAHPNEGLGLERFNYKKMYGSDYAAYIDLVQGKVMDEDDPRQVRGGGLPDGKYVFEVYNVRPRKKRLYPRSTVDKTTVPDGFELFKDEPVNVTTTFLRYALMQNDALYSDIGGANNNPIFYYLLQQPKTK